MHLLACLNSQRNLSYPSEKKDWKPESYLTKNSSCADNFVENIFETISQDIFEQDRKNDYKNTLSIVCYKIYEKMGVNKFLNIENETLMNFLKTIESLYMNNFYHNSIHATDVTASVACILNCGLEDKLNILEKMSMQVAATVHDVGHPGFNNNFMTSQNTSLSIVYNNQSVLENYHCSLTFQVLAKDSYNIFKNLTENDKKLCKKIIIRSIMDTDLSKHFEILKNFDQKIKNNFDIKNEIHKLNLISICLKTADIGHAAKELELHKTWSRRVTEEFFRQGDREKELGLSISPLCDRNNSNLMPVNKLQSINCHFIFIF